MIKVYSLSVRNRPAAALLGVCVIALGAVFLTLGFALLLGLVVAGGIIGAGVAGYRFLRGGARAPNHGFARVNLDQLPGGISNLGSGLDPTLEVKPVARAIVRPRGEND
jgi:hypothetical protein